MSDKLEAYLEEISHFLSGRSEREEILTDIRSHILEKAAEGAGGAEATDTAIERAIAAFGPARRVAERYLDESRPIIAPAYKRYLFRYTTLLFAFQVFLAVVGVIFKKDFVLFPFIFMPHLGVIEALMYLPTAFLTDLGIVTLVLYIVTQSGKDIRLPWPKFAVDINEVKPTVLAERIFTGVAAFIMLAITDFLVYLFVKHHTVFFVNLDWKNPRPLFTPGAGNRLSLILIAMFATSTMSLFIKVLTKSRWVDIVGNVVSLGLIGLILTQPWENLFAVDIAANLLPKIRYGVKFLLLFIAALITVDLIRHIVILSRRKLSPVTSR
jgi:HAAS